MADKLVNLTEDEKRKLETESVTNHKQVKVGKFVAFAHGTVIITASPKDVTIAGVVAEDTVIISVEQQDTTESAVTVFTGVAAAGKITITSDEVTTGDGVIHYVVYKAA